METRANYALIGAFTLAVIAAAFLFVFWFSGGEKAAGRKIYRIIFTGSVSGLSRGANVLFNGLSVGQVTSLGLMDEDPSRVAAMVEVVANTPVKVDTHAKLEFTGLTGIASIALAGGGADTDNLLPGQGGETPVIYGDRSDIQNLLATVQNLSGKADAILTKADALLAEGGSVQETLANAQVFSKALADNADGVGSFLKSAGDLGRSLSPLGPKIDSLVTNLDAVVKAVEPARVANIVNRVDALATEGAPALADTLRNAQAASKVLADNAPAVAAAIADVAQFTRDLRPVAGRIDTLAADADALVKGIDPAKVGSILGNLDQMLAQNAGPLKDTLQNAQVFSRALAESSGAVTSFATGLADIATRAQPIVGKLDALADNANAIAAAIDPAQVKALVGDSAELARQLNASAGKIDGLATQAGAVLGAVDPGKVRAIVDDIAEISGQLKAPAADLAAVAASARSLLAAVDPAQVKSIVGDSADVARQLNASAGKFDGLANQAGAVLGAVDPAKVRGIVDDAAEISRQLRTPAAGLGPAVAAAQDILAAIDPAQVKSIVADSADVARQLNASAGKIDGIANQASAVIAAVDPVKVRGIVDDAAEISHALKAPAADLAALTASAQGILGAIDPAQVKTIVSDSAGVARQLNASAGKIDGLAAQAGAVLGAVDAGKVRGIVDDAAEIARKVNGSAGKLDTLIATAQGLLGSPESRGTVADIGDAARSIRKLADNLDIRTRDIAAGVVKFTNSGLKQYEALAVDGRKTLDGVNRVVRSLEKNPSQVIFGGKSAIPEYSGN